MKGGLLSCIVVFVYCFGIAQNDTIRSYYLDKNNIKHTCTILIPKSKKERRNTQYDNRTVLDSLLKPVLLSAENCNGYDAGSLGYYKSFTRNLNGKPVSFFAKQLYKPHAEVFSYKGDIFNRLPVYIFKKSSDMNYIYMYQDIYYVATFDECGSSVNSTSSDAWPIMFLDEKPYLDFVYNYFSGCALVKSKRKSDRYGYSNIEAIFKDYNKCE